MKLLSDTMRNAIAAILILISYSVSGQELNCTIKIEASQVQTSDKSVFTDMERAFTMFMNTRKWTNDSYKNYEKIKCSIFLTLQMPSYGVFTGNAQIVASRPVFNSNYETVMFNFADRNWDFEYQESQPLEFNDNAYMSNLTSMLAYYAYLIIAMDYDSFSELGGTDYIQKAYQVVNNAQNSGRAGWTLGSNRNRYGLIEGFNNSQFIDWRKSTYTYHRLGLDILDKSPDECRVVILDVVTNLKKLWEINPASVMLVLFFDTKSTELANVFSIGNFSTRRKVYDLLSNMDPKRAVYDKIMPN